MQTSKYNTLHHRSSQAIYCHHLSYCSSVWSPPPSSCNSNNTSLKRCVPISGNLTTPLSSPSSSFPSSHLGILRPNFFSLNVKPLLISPSPNIIQSAHPPHFGLPVILTLRISSFFFSQTFAYSLFSFASTFTSLCIKLPSYFYQNLPFHPNCKKDHQKSAL